MSKLGLRARARRAYALITRPTVDDLDWLSNAVAGDSLSTISGIVSGATLTLVLTGSRIALDGTTIEKGAVPFAGDGSFGIRISHADAAPYQQPYVEYLYDYAVSAPPAGAVEFDIARSPGAGTWTVSTDKLTATSNGSPGNSTRRAIQITAEIPNGVKVRFGIDLSVGSNRTRIGFALKGLFDPTTAGSFDNIGDTAPTVGHFPQATGGEVQINGLQVAVIGTWGPGKAWIDVDTVADPPVWYLKRPGQMRSNAIPLPAGADDPDAILIPTVCATTDIPEGFTIDNDEANWPAGSQPGYSPLTRSGGVGGVVTAVNLTQITNAYGDGAIIEVDTDDQMGTLVIVNQACDPPMTIRAAAGRSPKFEGALIYNSTGVVLQGLDFMGIRDDAGRQQIPNGEITRIELSENITLDSNILRYKVAQETPPTYPTSIFPMGVYLRDSKAITIVENQFAWVGGGINVIDCGTLSTPAHGVEIIGNEMGYFFADDFIQASRSWYVRAAENTWHDIHLLIDNPSGDPSHVDLFQVVDAGDTVGYGPYTCEDNLYYRGTTLPGGAWGAVPALAQGIFWASQSGQMKIGSYIRRNRLYGTQNNAITVNNSLNTEIIDNEVWGFKKKVGLPVPPDSNRDNTEINFQYNDSITLSGNTAPQIVDEVGNTYATAPIDNDTGNSYYIDPFEGPPS